MRTVLTREGGYPIDHPVSSADAPLPANYQTVRDVVEAAGRGHHLTAHEIWVLARERAPRIGFATVHRALTRLAERGAVLKIDVPGGTSAVYEPPATHHAHFRCSACGSLSDLDFAVPPTTVAALAERHGIAIEAETVTFTGRCARCRKGANSL